MNRYALKPNKVPNGAICVQLDPIIYGQDMYYGWKIVYFKDVSLTDNDIKNYKSYGISDEHMPKTKSVIDTSKPVEYDNLTQQFMDSKNNNRLNSQSMLNNINQQRFNSQLMLDNMNLQKMASQLMLEINQLKTGGNK